jgi:MFS transporter, DHA1 family, inner membrane transport protein
MTISAPATRVTPRESFDRTGIVVLVTLCFAMCAGGINAMGLGPFLVDIGGDLGSSVPAVGQAMTVTLLMSAVSGIVAGPVADHFGHRRLMVAGAIVLAISALGTALATTYTVFMGARFIGGASLALLNGLSLAIAGSYFAGQARRRALSVAVASMSGVAILGVPFLSWLGGAFGWRWAFTIIGLLAIALTPFLHRLIPLTEPSTSGFRLTQLLLAYRPLLSQREVVALYVGSFLRAIFWLGTLTYFGAFVIERFGLSLEQVGLTYMFGGAGFLAGSLLAGGRIGWLDHRLVFTVSTIVGAAFFGLMYLISPGAITAVLLLAVGGCFGAIGWVILNTMLATESHAGAGTTMSLNTAVFNLGSAAGGAVGGVLLALGDYAALGFGLPVFAIAASLIVWVSGRNLREAGHARTRVSEVSR